MNRHVRLSGMLMAAGTVAVAMLVVVNARAGGDRESGAVEVACCGQVPNPDGGFDQHWEYDSDQAIPGWSCYPGAPMNCFGGSKPPIWLSIRPVGSGFAALASGIRDLQAVFGTLQPHGTLFPGFVAVNSQLMIVNKSVGQEGRKGKGAANLTIDEFVETMSIDPKSIAVPIRKGARLGTAPQICWGADAGGMIVEVPSKTGCLFPAQLLSCTKASQAHDDKLMQVTARANAILKKLSDSNRDPKVKLAIVMVRGRPALAWVSRERPRSRPAVGPDSPWEEVKAALHIAE